MFAGLVLMFLSAAGSLPQDAGLAAAPWASHSLLVHLVPEVLPTWLFINVCSLPSFLCPGTPYPSLTFGNFLFLHPILASSWISSPLFALTLDNCVLKCPLLSWILHHLGTLLSSCHSLPQHYLFLSWDLRRGFIEAE